jgi:hypothetical protein
MFEEERIPGEGPEAQLEHTLFATPANWHLGSSFGLAGPLQKAEDAPGDERPYTPCYIVEEQPPEPTRAAESPNEQSAKAATTEERKDNNHAEQHTSKDWDLLNLLFKVRQ